MCAAFTNRYNAYVLLEEKAFYYISYNIRIRCYSTFDLIHLQLIIYTWQFGVVNVHVLYCNKLSAICKFCTRGARRDIFCFCVISTAVNGLPSISSQLTKGKLLNLNLPASEGIHFKENRKSLWKYLLK